MMALEFFICISVPFLCQIHWLGLFYFKRRPFLGGDLFYVVEQVATMKIRAHLN